MNASEQKFPGLAARTVEIAKTHGLSDRPATGSTFDYIDLDGQSRVAFQIHVPKGRPEDRVLVFGDPTSDFPEPKHLKDFIREMSGNYSLLSGDGGSNKNWLRGIKNFKNLKPARTIFLDRSMAVLPDGDPQWQEVMGLVKYAVGRSARRC